MKQEDFRSGYPGRLVQGGIQAFIPNPLPPEITHGAEMTRAVAGAQEAIGRLDSIIPRAHLNPYLIVYPLMQREAYYSSLIEGTYTTPTQMALFSENEPGEGTGESGIEQTKEVFNYINSMQNGLTMVRVQGRHVEHGMVLELHRRLMSGVRGGRSKPGEYRGTQNFVGREIDGIAGARFVPPPPIEVRPLMEDLFQFVKDGIGGEAPIAYPIGLALFHYQFETIHPFEDGNGRIGRLMIPLILIEKKLMREPLLHVSASLERKRGEYKDRLLMVSQRGEWKEWICFFLRTMEESAQEAGAKVQSLLSLRESYVTKISAKRSSVLVVRLIEHLFQHPSITFNEAKDLLKVTHAQAAEHVRRLEALGILRKSDAQKRNSRFVASEIVETIFQ